MSRIIPISSMIIICCLPCWATAIEQDPGAIAAVRARAFSYAGAFNRGDVDAAAEHWAADAEYVLPDSGQRIRGRDSIHKALEKLKQAGDKSYLTLSGQKIRLVTDSVAIEEGTARLITPGQAPQQARYTTVHVKKDGKWYRDSIQETVVPVVMNAREQLAPLAWMVGTWNRQGENGSLTLNCQWSHNRNFLSRSYEMSQRGTGKITGTQTIGWDPSTGTIRSWSFDSEGGFEQALWKQDGKKWIVQVTAVFPDGRTGSEQRIIRNIDRNSFTWKTVNRQVDGALQAGADEVTITRKPQPAKPVIRKKSIKKS